MSATAVPDTRARILDTALRLFSQGGYDKVSVRDIALEAGVNVAAISYHFGGKTGLYRAALIEPLGSASDDIPIFDQPDFTLAESLNGLYLCLLEPFAQDARAQQCIRLHLREMLDPTGLWNEQVQNDFRPAHEALVRVLQRHLGLPQVDDRLLRLTMSLSGLALHLYISRDVLDALRPGLLNTPTQVMAWRQQLVEQALAMVAAERAFRAAPPPLRESHP
jgi:AcrR family transcriptional regulator